MNILPLLAALLPANDALALSAAELKIYSPAVEYQEKELEWRSFVSGKNSDHEQGHAVAVGYSPTSFWRAEIYEVLHEEQGLPMVGDAIEIENAFQLAAAGRFLLDPGLLIEAEIPQRAEDPGEVRVAPLLEKQAGPLLVTLNLPLGWKLGQGYTPGTTLDYAGKVEYLLNPYISPAVEIFGTPGVIGRWERADTQIHQFGPAFYGTWRWGQARQKLRYSAASLFGLSQASPDWTLIFRLEFEF
ncbi:MAG: hypothetical protein HY077_11505 [Elusimicrobia bacterium]|nr:hypothetical protein [Elusimicrobiota bacterium]